MTFDFIIIASCRFNFLTMFSLGERKHEMKILLIFTVFI